MENPQEFRHLHVLLPADMYKKFRDITTGLDLKMSPVVREMIEKFVSNNKEVLTHE